MARKPPPPPPKGNKYALGNNGGRPTKYEPRYCEEVVADMAKGYSLTAFAGKIGVGRETISEWARVHPEFYAAVSRAKAARCRNWEDVALEMRRSGGGPGGATITVFGLRNMGSDDWADRQQLEHTGKDGGPIKTEDATPRDILASKIAGLAAGRKPD